MFKLNKGLDINQTNDLEDSAHIKFALTSLGYYDDTDDGLAPYPTEKLFSSIKSFQKDNALEVDGVIKAEGPTQSKIIQRLQENVQKAGAFKDFLKNYVDMRKANTVNADKYFHCKANYEASMRGWAADEAARKLSEYRETFGNKIKGENKVDKTQDLIANGHGRSAARSGKYNSAEEACAIFRPEGLDDQF